MGMPVQKYSPVAWSCELMNKTEAEPFSMVGRIVFDKMGCDGRCLSGLNIKN